MDGECKLSSVVTAVYLTEVASTQYLVSLQGLDIFISGSTLVAPFDTLPASSAITSGWHMIGISRNDDRLCIFLDENQCASTEGPLLLEGGSLVGGNVPARNLPMKGTMALLAFYNRDITFSEFQAIRSSVKTNFVRRGVLLP